MILVDANLLIYAQMERFPQHEPALAWLDGQLNGAALVGLPWLSLLAFLRVVTNGRAFPRPMDVGPAWDNVQSWLACPVAWIPTPGERHLEILGGLLDPLGIHGDLVPDAHLAALAIEHGLTLCSTDGGFARFPGLRWENPIGS